MGRTKIIKLLPPPTKQVKNELVYYQSDKPLDIDSIDFNKRADELTPRGLLVTLKKPPENDFKFLYKLTISGKVLDLTHMINRAYFSTTSKEGIERLEQYLEENSVDVIYLNEELAVLRNRRCIREVVGY